MAARRAITEAVVYDEADEPIDLNNLRDDEVQEALALAYAMGEGEDFEDEEEEEEGPDDERVAEVDSDVDDIDFKNFKGIYFNDDPNRKY